MFPSRAHQVADLEGAPELQLSDAHDHGSITPATQKSDSEAISLCSPPL